MRTGETITNIPLAEKKAAQKASRKLRQALRAVLSPFKDSGLMLKSLKVSPQMKYDALDNLTVKATRVTFIQNYGFEI